MKYIIAVLLPAGILAACGGTNPSDAAQHASSAPAQGSRAHKLTRGEKLLARFFLKQDLAAYFKNDRTDTAFDDDQPLLSADTVAAAFKTDAAAAEGRYRHDTFGVTGTVDAVRNERGQTVVVLKSAAGAPPEARIEGRAGLKRGAAVSLICRGAAAQAGRPVLNGCIPEADFVRQFPDKVFAAIESGRVSNAADAAAEEAMAVKLIPFLAAASEFTGNFKACATTMTEYCVSRLARVMPETAVRAKAEELGLSDMAFKDK